MRTPTEQEIRDSHEELLESLRAVCRLMNDSKIVVGKQDSLQSMATASREIEAWLQGSVHALSVAENIQAQINADLAMKEDAGI